MKKLKDLNKPFKYIGAPAYLREADLREADLRER